MQPSNYLNNYSITAFHAICRNVHAQNKGLSPLTALRRYTVKRFNSIIPPLKGDAVKRRDINHLITVMRGLIGGGIFGLSRKRIIKTWVYSI